MSTRLTRATRPSPKSSPRLRLVSKADVGVRRNLWGLPQRSTAWLPKPIRPSARTRNQPGNRAHARLRLGARRSRVGDRDPASHLAARWVPSVDVEGFEDRDTTLDPHREVLSLRRIRRAPPTGGSPTRQCVTNSRHRRRATPPWRHDPKVGGSNPPRATRRKGPEKSGPFYFCYLAAQRADLEGVHAWLT